jgi:hypothetical protein
VTAIEYNGPALYAAMTDKTKRRLKAFARECIRNSGGDPDVAAGNPAPVCADCGADLDLRGRCKAGCANAPADGEERHEGVT